MYIHWGRSGQEVSVNEILKESEMKKLAGIIALLAMIMAAMTGVASAEKVLKIGVSKDPTNLNPILMQGFTLSLWQQVFLILW